MLIFDIGANIGKWSLSNSHLGNIISVEASPKTFSLLQSNVSDYKNIIPLNFAVSNSSSSSIPFFHCNTDTLSTLNKDWLFNPISRFYNYDSISEISCPVISLDSLISLYGIPDLLKIDVEGGEFDCISSLSQKVPLLCFEWASELHSVTLSSLHYLSSLGFSKFHLQFQDDYSFKPSSFDLSLDSLKYLLSLTTPKIDWGMIWCI